MRRCRRLHTLCRSPPRLMPCLFYRLTWCLELREAVATACVAEVCRFEPYRIPLETNMNRRLFLAGTAAGAGCLALPAMASLPPAPFAFEVACGVATHLNWWLLASKKRHLSAWYTKDSVVPTHDFQIDVPRRDFGTTASEYGDKCNEIAIWLKIRMSPLKPYMLFLHTSKFDYANVYEGVAIQSKQSGDTISVGLTYRAFDDPHQPLPLRHGLADDYYQSLARDFTRRR
jgi:hypothetical protein